MPNAWNLGELRTVSKGIRRDNNPAGVTVAVAVLSDLFRVHGGGLELEEVSSDGRVRVRFTGMCAGCQFRPMTMAGSIRPLLLTLEGVNEVEADGSRISEEALTRLRLALEPYSPPGRDA
jgi:Fe-S cluster biogenesis protein NfuA